MTVCTEKPPEAHTKKIKMKNETRRTKEKYKKEEYTKKKNIQKKKRIQKKKHLQANTNQKWQCDFSIRGSV